MSAGFRILALDGGGLRGLFTLGLLRRLEAARPGLCAAFDLYAGTSTGAIIAAGLACGLGLDELEGLYLQKARDIFSTPSNLGMVGAKYGNAGLREAISGTFGARRLRDVPRRLLIPSFFLGGTAPTFQPWKPKFFHNLPGADSDAEEGLADVVIRSCSGPTYFPSYQDHVDGGVAANNPSLAAVATALDPRNGVRISERPARLEDLRVLSLGTGAPRRALPSGDHDWGKLHWSLHLTDLIFEGLQDVPDFQCRQILGAERYCRLAPPLDEAIELDDLDNLQRLRDWAARDSVGVG